MSSNNYICCVPVATDLDVPTDSTIEKCDDCGCAVWVSVGDRKVFPADSIPICDACAIEMSKRMECKLVMSPPEAIR